MDTEADKHLLYFNGKSYRIFEDFLSRTTKLDGLVDIGRRFLDGFHQELDMYKRTLLLKTSDLANAIIEANNTHRMKTYCEAGYKLPHLVAQNISKLDSCIQGLQDYLKKVKNIFDELELLKEDAVGIALEVNQNASVFTQYCFQDDMKHQVLSSEEGEIEPMHNEADSLVCLSMMVAILKMLKLDYSMQENIIMSLNFNTSSSELESYRLMWDLRPYINENIMIQAWNLIQ